MSHKVLLLLLSLLTFGCTKAARQEPIALSENMTECKVYRTGGASTYYLLRIYGDKIEAQYFQSNVVKKSLATGLSKENYRQFVLLFGRALSQKKLPYTFWKGGEEMLIKNGDMKLLLALGDVKDGVYPKDVTDLVDFIYAVSPIPLELAGY